MDYLAQLKAHVEAYAQSAEQSAADHVRSFVAWIEGKQAEEATTTQYKEWLEAHGWTVTK